MYGSRSRSRISTPPIHSFSCSSVGALVWLFRRSTSSGKLNDLPSGGLVKAGVSVLMDVDKAGLQFEFYMLSFWCFCAFLCLKMFLSLHVGRGHLVPVRHHLVRAAENGPRTRAVRLANQPFALHHVENRGRAA